MVLQVDVCRSQCELVLRQALREDATNASLRSFELCPISAGAGFMGDHNTLRVTYDIHGQEKQLMCFIKQVPQDEHHYSYVVGEGLFAKESEIYQRIIPDMCRYMNITNLPTPKCYFISEGEFMVFEDLTELGYKLVDKRIPLDKKHCELALQAFARLHAGSIVTEKKSGRSMTSRYEHCYEVLFVPDGSKSVARSWRKTSLDTAFGVMKKLDPYKERFDGKWDMVYDKLFEAWEIATRYAGASDDFINVICHGDPWSNNLLYKYSGKNGSPSDVALVDLQLFRYAPPAVDIIMFLHVTTSRAFRERHLLGLLLSYHKALNSALGHAGLPEDVLTFSELVRSVEALRLFGVVVAARYLPTCLMPNEVREDADGGQLEVIEEFAQDCSELTLRGFELSPSFEKRMLEAIDELLDYVDL